MSDRDHVRYVANNLAWFAAVNPRISITCALHRLGHSGARLAMSSPWHNGDGRTCRRFGPVAIDPQRACAQRLSAATQCRGAQQDFAKFLNWYVVGVTQLFRHCFAFRRYQKWNR